MAHASVDPCVARPDLGQQQGAIGKHGGSAEVWGAAKGKGKRVVFPRSGLCTLSSKNAALWRLQKGKDRAAKRDAGT